MRRFLSICLLLCLLFLPGAQAENVHPALTDWAGVMTEQTAEDLSLLSERLLEKTEGRLYVVTRHFLGGRNHQEYARELFQDWQLMETDGLLLMVIGEEKFALEMGQKAENLLSGERRTALLAAFRTAFLARDYEGAVAAFAPDYAKALSKDVNTAGLFGSEEIKTPTAWENAGALWQDMFGQPSQDAEDWRREQEQEETESNWKTVIIWGLVIYFLFFRKKKKKKKKNRFNFGHAPRR